VASSSSKSAASTIGVPSASAFFVFDAPGASPTTTAYVFFETDPGDLPPRTTIASSASSRL